MDAMQCIRERHSVRSYRNQKIEPEKAALIREEIGKINAESGLHIQFMEDADGALEPLLTRAIRWKYVPAYLAMVGKDDPAAEEAVGYWGERLVLFLQSIGLNTCWVGMFKGSAVKAETAPGEKVIITVAVGYGTDSGKPHHSKATADVTDVPDAEQPDWFKAGMEAALLAPTAINQQNFMISLDGEKPVLKIAGKGPYLRVDLGIVKCHFEIGSGKKM